MSSGNVIVTLNLIKTKQSHDLEIPLDISAGELCSALYQKYLSDCPGDIQEHYLRTERPIALLRGERTLREYGIHDGSVINITR